MRRREPPWRRVMKCHVLHARGSYAVAGSGMKPSTLRPPLPPSGREQAPDLPFQPGRSVLCHPLEPAFRPASPPVRVGDRLRSSSLLLRREAGPFSARILRGRACACRRAFRGGAVRAPDCAREAEGARLPSASHGFSKIGAARPRGTREAAPDFASLGTIIPHSARCQAHIGNKIHKYWKLFIFCESGRDRCLLAAEHGPVGVTGGSRLSPRRWRMRSGRQPVRARKSP